MRSDIINMTFRRACTALVTSLPGALDRLRAFLKHVGPLLCVHARPNHHHDPR